KTIVYRFMERVPVWSPSSTSLKQCTMSRKPKSVAPPSHPERTRFALILLLGLTAFGATYGIVLFVQSRNAPPGMVWIPGGEFTMGSESTLPRQQNERPTHRVRVDGFWMDEHNVTNAELRQFVEATGHVTTAERKPDWEEVKKQY